LGLYIVKTIARLHGGRIELESGSPEEGRPWKGNRFTISLPRAEARP
jgi:signal transduction histidine kinase